MATHLKYVDGQEGLDVLAEMLEKAEAGELDCVALRIFRSDGTVEDIAFGGTEEEQAAALAALKDGQAGLH